jgi:2-dehydropantoate 2-reductase
LRTRDERFQVRVPAVAKAEGLKPFRAGDVVLLCAKTQQTLKCLAQLRQAGAPPSLPVFCCQNSFFNEAQTSLFFDRVYGVAVLVDGIFVQPGEAIHPTGRRYGHLEMGRFPAGVDPLCRRVAADLRRAGFSVRTTPDIMKTKRAKFVVNMANAVIAATNQPDQAGSLVRKLRAEAVRILEASGMTCEPMADFKARGDAACGELELPPDAKPSGLVPDSTWQSLYRRTGNIETPYFNGAVVHLGRSLGLPTPYNSFIADIVADMSRRGHRPGKYTAKELLRRADQAARKAR